jgi:3-oxoacyl-[acyl-carrier protein] reductase
VKLLEEPEENREPESAEKLPLTVVVTGASGGIGREIALLLAQNGYGVVINYNRDEAGAGDLLNRIRNAGGRAVICRADVTDEGDVDRMFSLAEHEFGPVTHLVNNASPKIIEKNFLDTEWEDFAFQLNIQLRGSYLCAKRAIPGMLKSGRGSIVNIGSSVIEGTPPPKWTAYTVAKASLASLTKNLAMEFGNKGIRVNMVSPGMTDTKLISEIPEKQRLIQAAQTPLRRIAGAGEIARACLFLLSDEASYITGENLRVTGGKVMF